MSAETFSSLKSSTHGAHANHQGMFFSSFTSHLFMIWRFLFTRLKVWLNPNLFDLSSNLLKVTTSAVYILSHVTSTVSTPRDGSLIVFRWVGCEWCLSMELSSCSVGSIIFPLSFSIESCSFKFKLE